MAHGAWRMAHGAWRMAHGAWRMAHGAWRMAHGARNIPRWGFPRPSQTASMDHRCCPGDIDGPSMLFPAGVARI
jgi:hypothetical protein